MAFSADTLHPEHACGPFGLARVKNYDRRFAFYPGFSAERSLALEFRAEGISQLSMEIQALWKELDSAGAGKSLKQPLAGSEQRLPILMTRLSESIAQYGRSTTRTTDLSIPQLIFKRKMLPGCTERWLITPGHQTNRVLMKYVCGLINGPVVKLICIGIGNGTISDSYRLNRAQLKGSSKFSHHSQR